MLEHLVLSLLVLERGGPLALRCTTIEAGIGGRLCVELGDLLLSIEYRGGLFQRAVLGLDDEEPHKDELKEQEHAVHDVVLPCEGVERDGVRVLVEDESARDGEVEDSETLGAEFLRQDLDGI